MTTSGAAPSTSPYFTLERVADGVWAAIATPGSGASANAGIVDLGGETLVFDTMCALPAARDLRAAAEGLTGRAPRYVVTSCATEDHALGVMAFDGAEYIVSQETYYTLINTLDLVLGVLIKTNGPRIITEHEATIATLTDPAIRASYEEMVNDLRAVVAAGPETHLVLPDRQFEERLTLHGTYGAADLIALNNGFTALHLPERAVLFAGDLVLWRRHPPLSHRSIRAWWGSLDALDALDARAVVPGHGAVCGHEAIEAQRDYFRTLLALARAGVAEGRSRGEMYGIPIPDALRSWGWVHGFSDTLARAWDYVTSDTDPWLPKATIHD